MVLSPEKRKYQAIDKNHSEGLSGAIDENEIRKWRKAWSEETGITVVGGANRGRIESTGTGPTAAW